MHVLILAAGFGTRLHEFGKNIPKGLIPMGKTTLIEKIVDELSDLPLTIVTNARFFQTYAEWIAEHKKDVELIDDGATAPETRLGAIGDILFVTEKNQWWDDDLLVVPSDTYYEFPILAFAEFAKEKGSFATVVRKMSAEQIAGRLGCAVVNGEEIIEFVEKPVSPPSDFAAIPFYYYPKEVLTRLPEYKKEGGNMDAPGSIIPWFLAKQIPVFAYITKGETLDVGTVSDVEKLGTYV